MKRLRRDWPHKWAMLPFNIKDKYAEHPGPFPLLKSDRLVLRPAVTKDYDQWKTVRRENYPFLKPFEPTWPENWSAPEVWQRRVERLNRDWVEGRTFSFLLFMQDILIGGVNLNHVIRGAAQHAMLGYWLSRDYQGAGYMTEAAFEVIRYAFTVQQLQRINAAALVHNQKSRNLLNRLGFAEEGFARGYIQIDGIWQDHVLYGLNAPDR